jgi:hypothetical protein
VVDSCEAVVVVATLTAAVAVAAALSALAESGTSVSSGGKKNSSDVMMVSTTAFAVLTSLSARVPHNPRVSAVIVLLSPHTQHATHGKMSVPKYKFGLGVVLL